MMAELAPQNKSGEYSRPKYTFSGRIGDENFPDEPNRYHLYVGNPCPWCHRARLVLALRNVDVNTEVGVTILIDDPIKASRGGWVFGASKENVDPLFGCDDLRVLYDRLSPGMGGYKGRCTAPLLVDLKSRRIVSNESKDIVRMLGSATFGKETVGEDRPGGRMDLYPSELRERIDRTNDWVYSLLNNGVYRCGFSTSQGAYDRASADVLEGLSRVENVLSEDGGRPYLNGEAFTESDLFLLPTALRFDGAYGPLFRAGGAHVRLRGGGLSAYARVDERCWNMEGAGKGGLADTVDLGDACASYYRQLFPLNPGGIVPTTVTAKDIGLSD